MAALQRGDARAFEGLYRRFFSRVYAFARRRVGDRTEAEDLTQEVFLAALRSARGYAGEAEPGAWLFGVARNVVRDHHRRRARREARDVPQAEAPAPDGPEEALGARRVAHAVDRALREADPWEARVFSLHYLERVPVREIARREARSRHAVAVSLARLRRRLLREAPPPG